MLEAADLACERGGQRLFRGMSFSVASGETLRITGANGSGKTSLLRILCGLLAPSAGEVRWEGNPIGALREEFSRRLVYLGHAPAVKGDLSASENLGTACTLAGLAASKQAVEAALERFGVTPDETPVSKLSQGQRRRVALARLALSEAARLWLLDEPFSALDTHGIGVLNDCLEKHLKKGGAIAFTTHQEADIVATQRVDLG
jgi:heme exporter protein A